MKLILKLLCASAIFASGCATNYQPDCLSHDSTIITEKPKSSIRGTIPYCLSGGDRRYLPEKPEENQTRISILEVRF